MAYIQLPPKPRQAPIDAKMNKIVITGPECSGKTSLAGVLHKKLGGVMVPEFARSYLMLRKGNYDQQSFRQIVRGQKSLEDAAFGLRPAWVFQDTSYFVLRIWSQLKFGEIDPVIMEEYGNEKADHYLLCLPDIPWTQDGLRENPDDRWSIFYLYHKALIESGRSFIIIDGTPEQRTEKAIQFLTSGEL